MKKLKFLIPITAFLLSLNPFASKASHKGVKHKNENVAPKAKMKKDKSVKATDISTDKNKTTKTKIDKPVSKDKFPEAEESKAPKSGRPAAGKGGKGKAHAPGLNKPHPGKGHAYGKYKNKHSEASKPVKSQEPKQPETTNKRTGTDKPVDTEKRRN